MLNLEKLKKYSGSAKLPTDFNDYWNKALKEVHALPTSFKLSKVDLPSKVAAAYHLWFKGVKGASIHCQFIIPKNLKKDSLHKAMLLFHGYHSDSGDFQDKFGLAAEGFIVLAMDARGQGGLSEDTSATKGNTMKGLIIRGIQEGPENLYYRSVFLDTVQAARILMSLDYVDQNRIYVSGASQGGGLSIACASLVPQIHRVLVDYPFLTDYRMSYQLGAESSAYEEIPYWFRFKDPLHEQEEAFFNTLEYIDIQNLASRIKAEVIWIMGLKDTIVPPQLQFATYNKIDSPKQLVLLPEYGHEYLPKVSDKFYKFFMD
jgi:cephalosporin-C deacetylase